MEKAEALQVVKAAPLVKFGGRSVSTRGYRNDVVLVHLSDHAEGPPSGVWCRVGCLARTMFGRDTKTHREGIRRRLAATFRALLRREEFLVIEHDPTGHGKATAIKLYRNGEGAEGQYALEQINRMWLRREVNEETEQLARRVLAKQTGGR